MMKYGYPGKDETEKQPLRFLTYNDTIMHSQELESKNTDFQIPHLSLFQEKLKGLCR